MNYIGLDIPKKNTQTCVMDKNGKAIVYERFLSIVRAINSFLYRTFYAYMLVGGCSFYLKPGAAVVSTRRAGTTAALDQLNKFFAISEMPIMSARYWNMVHGVKPEDV